MSFIRIYPFRAEIPKPALLEFIARTPPDCFCFLVASGPWVYGLFLSEEVVEYFTNEFPCHRFEIVAPEEVRKARFGHGCKVWGNAELLTL
ncbi:hypothetical protein V9K67_02095 [Paraflavisolibacter sp. H34]|uniref:hypothetical protein n=1 Tax=Huijunlia imazamoxiresistens TaxID=3127457 RepID=UPI00301604DD